MLFLGSPFPWSPGHVVMEIEYLIQKRMISYDEKTYDMPIFTGPVSYFFKQAYGEYLKTNYNINLILENKEIEEVISSTSDEEIKNISMSHSQFVRDPRVSENEYRKLANPRSMYTTLKCNKLVEYSGSTKLVNSVANEFACNQYRVLNNKQLLPSVECNITQTIIPQSKDSSKLVLINIREHVANGNGATTLSDYMPLIAYCKSKDYCIVDVSYEKKSYLTEVDELGLVPYWNIENKNFLCDIDLFSKASYYIGTGGPTHLALALRIPTIWVNGLTPMPLATRFGYQLPISLHTKTDLKRLSTAEGTEELLNLKNGWEDGYDCWAKKWGEGNPFNCMEELKTRYRMFKPTGMEILRTFIQLESDVENNVNNGHETLSTEKDLFDEEYIGMKISPFW